MRDVPCPSLTVPRTVAELLTRVQRGEYGPDPAQLPISVAFLTSQRAQHVGRQQGYTNHVVSLRVGQAVGSCFVEPDQCSAAVLDACIGEPLSKVLAHPLLPVRIAALDAYLGEIAPHDRQPGARPIMLEAGSSQHKSLQRARAVVRLLRVQPGQRVALIGVVNSLIQALAEAGATCLPCDLHGMLTEWGEPIARDMELVLPNADAILATGMTLANGSFDRLLAYARMHHVPLVVFAQTGSAIVPQFLRHGVTAVSAEPYPFFWLSGGATMIYHYHESDHQHAGGEPQ